MGSKSEDLREASEIPLMTYSLVSQKKAGPELANGCPRTKTLLEIHKIAEQRRRSLFCSWVSKTNPYPVYQSATGVGRTLSACMSFLAILAISLGALILPRNALANTGQPPVYVTHPGGMLVLDSANNEVIATFGSAVLPTALTPDNQHLYTFGTASDLVAKIVVINTDDNRVGATIALDVSLVGGVSLNQSSHAIAVSPDGKRVYVTTGLCPFPALACHPESVYFVLWEIDTATNKVVAASLNKGTVNGIAFSPDSQHIYLTNFDPFAGNPRVLVIAAGDTISLPGIVIPLPGFSVLDAVAVSLDGKHAYVPYALFSNGAALDNLAVIDTATNTITKTVLIGTSSPLGDLVESAVVVAPNGRHVFVTFQGTDSVTVIKTSNDLIVSTIPVGTEPSGLAITPDGAHLYVSNQGSNSVSVINTNNNKVLATILISSPSAIAIVPPPQGVRPQGFNAIVQFTLNPKPALDAFNLQSTFINKPGQEIHPDLEPFNLQVGPFIEFVPTGSFIPSGNNTFVFKNTHLTVTIELKVGLRFAFVHAEAAGVDLRGTANPVQVSMSIGPNAGLAVTQAHISGP
jgi:YVTN family beta-propeller protein